MELVHCIAGKAFQAVALNPIFRVSLLNIIRSSGAFRMNTPASEHI